MPTPIIELKDIKKSFGRKAVLKGLTFSIEPGELIALLGCNGAGKTTTMNILLGLENADSGTARLFNQPPGAMSVKAQLGVTPQGTDFPEGLKVKEILAFVAAHYDHPLSVTETIERFSLDTIADQLTAGLSYGQKRRVAVASSFIGNPKCIFLDEPTTGLDVQSRHALWDITRTYVENGGTLILTTHYLEEAEKLASRVLVLDDGVIRTQGTVAEIIAESGMMSISFNAKSCPQTLEHAATITQTADSFVLETTNSDALIRELVDKQVPFEHLIVHKSSLEAAFLDINNTSGNI